MSKNPSAEELESFANSLSKEDAQAYLTRGADGLSPEGFQHLSSLYGEQPAQPPREEIAGMPVSKPAGLPMADWTVPVANFLKKNVAQPLSEAGNDISGMGNNPRAQMVGGLLKGASVLTPQTPGDVKLNMVAPIVAGGLGMAGSAAIKSPLGQLTIKNVVAPVVQGLSKLPANLVEKVLQSPEILDRYLPMEQAGKYVSQFFKQFGLKSGSEALGTAAEVAAEAAPALSDARPLANRTMQAIKNEPHTLAAMQKLEQEGAQLLQALQESQAPGLVPQDAKFNGRNAYNAALERLQQIRQEHQLLQSQLPTAQDAIATRTFISKSLNQQMQQTVDKQVITPLTQGNLDLADHWLDKEISRLVQEAALSGQPINPISIPGYGEVSTPQQIRQIYHEAKIGEAFSSIVPRNRNGQADALRTALGFLESAANPTKIPAAVGMSPLAWKGLIQGTRMATNPLNLSLVAEGKTVASNLMRNNGTSEGR